MDRGEYHARHFEPAGVLSGAVQKLRQVTAPELDATAVLREKLLEPCANGNPIFVYVLQVHSADCLFCFTIHE